jgi:hypothetical protein
VRRPAGEVSEFWKANLRRERARGASYAASPPTRRPTLRRNPCLSAKPLLTPRPRAHAHTACSYSPLANSAE